MFFFSSRRRHTRSYGDWSSDVCSSDLYKALADNYYDQSRILLSLLPLAMRMAGPREALWHALIRRNYGASHIIIGRDHASPGMASNGRPYYAAYAAQELVEQFSDEIGIRPLHYSEFVYLPDE